MNWSLRDLTLAALLCLPLACSHGRVAVARVAPPNAPAWPAAPAQPLVRFVGNWPDPEADAAARGWWTRAFDLLAGLDPSRPERALVRPFGVAVRSGSLLVADPDERRVLRLDLATGEVNPVVCEGQDWVSPMAVAFGERGEVYVADSGEGVVARVEGDRCLRIGKGVLERPTGLAVSGQRVYVVDPPRHRVVAFAPTGAELSSFGSRGEDEGQLNYPTALAVVPDGSLLVVDSLNFRVVHFSAEGGYLGAFGSAGDAPGEFARPKAVAIGERGQIFVSDSSLDQVLAFDGRGSFLYAFGGSGSGPGQLLMPAGLAAAGRFLYVADSLNGRLAIYELLGDAS